MTHRWEAFAQWVALAFAACTPASAPATDPTPAPTHSSAQSPWPGAKVLPLGNIRAFVLYVEHVHARVHPLFADGFLAGLDSQPPSDPRNVANRSTEVALVIDGRSGRLDSAKVIRTSGTAGFDAGVLDSVTRAFPSNPSDVACWSSDGKVYLTWEFHRGPEACGTWNVGPYRLAF